ncbi:hypothetical protein BKA81DRAFT_360914 [Phyllosticta paracitricarpa]
MKLQFAISVLIRSTSASIRSLIILSDPVVEHSRIEVFDDTDSEYAEPRLLLYELEELVDDLLIELVSRLRFSLR